MFSFHFIFITFLRDCVSLIFHDFSPSFSFADFQPLPCLNCYRRLAAFPFHFLHEWRHGVVFFHTFPLALVSLSSPRVDPSFLGALPCRRWRWSCHPERGGGSRRHGTSRLSHLYLSRQQVGGQYHVFHESCDFLFHFPFSLSKHYRFFLYIQTSRVIFILCLYVSSICNSTS